MINMQRFILLGVWSLTICSCSSSEPDNAAAKKSASAPQPVVGAAPRETRIEKLLGVTSSEPPSGSPIPFGPAAMTAPAAWPVQGGDDLGSAMNTLTQKEIRAHCYMTDRLQKGDPMAGIKLWTSSAGGKPASFQGPEPIEIGPTRAPADLYWGEGGVTLGSPGQGRPGTTIAIRPKARPSLLVVGVVRADAPDAMKKQLAGCLQSFQLR